MKNLTHFALILAVTVSVSSRFPEKSLVGRPGPHIIVYKTKSDYSKYVPINLSDDKSRIVSYPAPQDLYSQGKLAMPEALAHGYWLDRRGIGPNTVFIKLTYEEYAKMPQAPSMDELLKMIIDKEPFTEMYDLGLRNSLKNGETVEKIVKEHKLKEYKKLI